MKYELISMLINLNMNQQLYIDAHLPSRVFIIKIQEQTMCLDQLVRQRLPIHISKKIFNGIVLRFIFILGKSGPLTSRLTLKT